MHNGVPSAVVGSMVQAVKSIPMPITVAGLDARLREHCGHGVLESADVVGRVLQRPVRLEPDVGVGSAAGARR